MVFWGVILKEHTRAPKKLRWRGKPIYELEPVLGFIPVRTVSGERGDNLLEPSEAFSKLKWSLHALNILYFWFVHPIKACRNRFCRHA
jgi:hypothetical protein